MHASIGGRAASHPSTIHAPHAQNIPIFLGPFLGLLLGEGFILIVRVIVLSLHGDDLAFDVLDDLWD